MSTSEMILEAAKQSAQAHGYNGLNFRDLATEVGIKAASIYHHFPSKADLGAAVAKRYWEDTAAALDAISAETSDPKAALGRFPEGFRESLERNNRLCLGSFMSAEYDDLPDPVKKEVQTFADINVAWLTKQLIEADVVGLTGHVSQWRTVDRDRAGRQVESQVTEGDERRVLGAGAAQRGTDTGEQFVGIERLRQVIARAFFQSSHSARDLFAAIICC